MEGDLRVSADLLGGAGEREARLVRMVEQLRRRMDQLRSENGMLEEELRIAECTMSGGVLWRSCSCWKALLQKQQLQSPTVSEGKQVSEVLGQG
jgi:hypothetical protein